MRLETSFSATLFISPLLSFGQAFAAFVEQAAERHFL